MRWKLLISAGWINRYFPVRIQLTRNFPVGLCQSPRDPLGCVWTALCGAANIPTSPQPHIQHQGRRPLPSTSRHCAERDHFHSWTGWFSLGRLLTLGANQQRSGGFSQCPQATLWSHFLVQINYWFYKQWNLVKLCGPWYTQGKVDTTLPSPLQFLLCVSGLNLLLQSWLRHERKWKTRHYSYLLVINCVENSLKQR